jgi:endonuclease YncB( thermonuclease family)
LLTLLVVGFLGYAQWKGWLPGSGSYPDNSSHPPVVTPGKPKPSRPPTAEGTRQRTGDWEELHGCTLVEDRSNDGDSFLVRHGTTDFLLRLYFVDCPEKTRHQYNGPRLASQGQYFGGLTEAETLEVGGEARDFTLGLLQAAPFRVLTRWEKVFDSDRIYAFVTVDSGDLGELLIKAGLARIYTKGENRPGGKTSKAGKQQLMALERQAKASKQGAWGRR